MPDNVGNTLKIKIILNSTRQQGCIVFMRVCIQVSIKFIQESFFYSISQRLFIFKGLLSDQAKTRAYQSDM